MAIVYEKSKALTDKELHYCPGCHHGIVHKLVAETLDEMDGSMFIESDAEATEEQTQPNNN